MNFILKSLAALLVLLVLNPIAAFSQSFPMQSVRVIVPAAPGGGVDIMARLLTNNFSESLGQRFIVENRNPSVLAGEIVAKAPANGQVLMLSTATYLVNKWLYNNMTYEPLRDIAPISLIGSTPIIIVSHPSLPVRNVKDLIELAKRKPGALNFASGGNGSPLHLAGELFKLEAKVNIIHVAYRGTAPAAADMLSGQVQVMFPSVISMFPHIQSGRTRVLAILSPKRSQSLPDVPTSAESGLPDLNASIWFGLLTTNGTPKSVIDFLHQATVKTLANKEFRERLARDNVDPIGNSPEEFAAYASSESSKWGRVIKVSNIKVH